MPIINQDKIVVHPPTALNLPNTFPSNRRSNRRWRIAAKCVGAVDVRGVITTVIPQLHHDISGSHYDHLFVVLPGDDNSSRWGGH